MAEMWAIWLPGIVNFIVLVFCAGKGWQMIVDVDQRVERIEGLIDGFLKSKMKEK